RIVHGMERNRRASASLARDARLRFNGAMTGTKASAELATGVPPDALAAWQAHFRRGDLQGCEALARALTMQFPQAGKAWQLSGATLLSAGRIDEALAALQKASALAPNDWTIWDNLGIALQRSGDFAAAAHAFRSGLHEAPTQPRLWSNASANALESG